MPVFAWLAFCLLTRSSRAPLSWLCQIAACNNCAEAAEPVTSDDSLRRGVHFSRPSSWLLAAAGEDAAGSSSGSEDGGHAPVPPPSHRSTTAGTDGEAPTWNRKSKPPKPPPRRKPVRPAPPVVRPRSNPFGGSATGGVVAPPPPLPLATIVVPSGAAGEADGRTMRLEHVLSDLSSSDEAAAVPVDLPGHERPLPGTE